LRIHHIYIYIDVIYVRTGGFVSDEITENYGSYENYVDNGNYPLQQVVLGVLVGEGGIRVSSVRVFSVRVFSVRVSSWWVTELHRQPRDWALFATKQ
jgi:hypothetical protein